MNRIVITGAAGFIGTATYRELRSHDHEVVGLDIQIPREHWRYGDITRDDLTEKFKPGDKVLHLATLPASPTQGHASAVDENPITAVKVNIGGTLNVVRACNKVGVERLIFSSTGSVISPKAEVPFREDAPVDPPNLYGWTKAIAEDGIKRFCRVPWIILRYGYVYGPTKLRGAIGSFIRLLREGKQPTIYGGKQTNDFTHIEDIVQANRKALFTEHTNQIYHIGSGRANSILDVFDVCCDALDIQCKPIMAPARLGDYPVFLYDISKARSLLGYEPEYPLKKGIKKMVKELE